MLLRQLMEEGEIRELHGTLDQPISGLAYDSRRVRRGDAFFALVGQQADGHEFVHEAAIRGAPVVVVEKSVSLPPETIRVRVPDTRRAMARCASRFYGVPTEQMILVGVTGTNGKTTVCYLLEAIFTAAQKSCGVLGTIQNRSPGWQQRSGLTTPESLELQALMAQMVESGVEVVAMEVSSHALEMERVRGVAFDGAIFTNLSHDHLDYHRDMASYFKSKARLFNDYLPESPKAAKFAVINGDDERGRALIAETTRRGEVRVVSFGRASQWDVHPVTYACDAGGIRAKIQCSGQIVEIASPLFGDLNLENLLASVGTACAMGVFPEAIAAGVARLESVPGRLERIRNERGIVAVVDYAHTPDALKKVCDSLCLLKAGRLITVFGCGGDRDHGKRGSMGEIGARASDLLVLTSDNPRSEEPLRIIQAIEEGVRRAGMPKGSLQEAPTGGRRYYVEPDRRKAILFALSLATASDILLVAGKGHEDYQLLGSKRLHFDDRELLRQALA